MSLNPTLQQRIDTFIAFCPVVYDSSLLTLFLFLYSFVAQMGGESVQHIVELSAKDESGGDLPVAWHAGK